MGAKTFYFNIKLYYKCFFISSKPRLDNNFLIFDRYNANEKYKVLFHV